MASDSFYLSSSCPSVKLWLKHAPRSHIILCVHIYIESGIQAPISQRLYVCRDESGIESRDLPH